MFNMKKGFVVFFCIIGGLCAVIALILSAVQLVIFDESRFHKAYEEYNRYEYIGISEDDLHRVTHELLEYMKGNREDIVMYADINGEEEMVFEEREQLHMVDVLKLCNAGFIIRNVCAVLAVAIFFLAWCLYKKQGLRYISAGYLAGFGIILAGLVALVIAMIRDFSALFTKFHMLLFDNDLWLLDPRTDIMINMFPEEFFNTLGIAIGVFAIIFVSIPAVAAIIYLSKSKKAKA